MTEETKKKMMGKINEIKSNIETFIADVNVNDLKTSFNHLVKDAQSDLNKLIDRDLDNMKKKLQKEKEEFETKAKKFLEAQKKELSILQGKFDRLVKATAKLKKRTEPKGAVKAEAPSKKRIVKKVGKASKKPGFKTKSTKKVSSKK